MKDNQVKAKMNSNAKHFRYVSRAEAFQQKRKTYDQLDYLLYYHPQVREMILYSMQGPIPDPLPPLTLTTISFYRRKSQPVYATRHPESKQLEGHMTYQSLWILSSLQQKSFPNYQSVVKEFERDLMLYLSANSSDIREMAVIAAGNKIIGKQSEIISIVEKDQRQLWVLANHVYQNKIGFEKLFPFLQGEHEIVFKTLFELTMLIQNDSAETIMKEEEVVNCIMNSARGENQTLRKYSMRIMGNIVAARDEHISRLIKLNVLDGLLLNLSCTNGEIRRDACWLLSNLCTKKTGANAVVRRVEILEKLVDLFAYEVIFNIKRELSYLFCNIAHFGDKRETLLLLGQPKMLEICYNQLCLQEVDLNIVTLLLLKQLLQLGDNFKNEECRNVVLELMKHYQILRSEISNKSYSQNNEISSISIQILNYLQEEE